MDPSELVPMRWPGGAAWQTPAALSLLEGTPINCLLLTPGQPEGFVAIAKSRGLTVFDTGKLPGTVAAPEEPVWPGVKLGRRGEAEAGPTGPPWVDSNGWRCMLTRAKSPGKPVWVLAEPPADLSVSAGAYAVAVADAAAYGGRWVVTLDPSTEADLLRKDAAAVERWAETMRAVRFFEQHKSWRELPVAARFGVVSDFEGPNEFIAQELLNLAPRRYLSCRVIHLPRTTAASLEGLKGVIWADEKAPAGATLGLLDGFVTAGGLLIVPSSAAHLTDKLGAAKRHKTGYAVFPSGKGRIAVAPEPWTDPYAVIADAHLLLSRQHDIYRLFNSGASNVQCTSGPNGRTILQILNYTGRTTGNPMSAFVTGRHTTATYWTLSATTGERLKVVSAPEGVEVNLPAFSAYAAVEFGGQS